MADLFRNGLLYLISEDCFDKYFYEYDFLDVDCFKAVLSKGLGIGIILGSLLVKVPQILKILGNKSAEGLNLFSVCLDLFAITAVLSYGFVSGFPFSSWGDNMFLALQTAAIGALILFYSGSPAKSVAFIALYLGAVYVLVSGLTPLEFIRSMQAINIPILVTGKLSQAYTNYKNGSTGQLSAVTCFMLLAGSLARIFTSIQETGDSMMILTFMTSSSVNGIIAAQILYYWNKSAPPKGKKAQQKQQQKAAAAKSRIKAKKVD